MLSLVCWLRQGGGTWKRKGGELGERPIPGLKGKKATNHRGPFLLLLFPPLAVIQGSTRVAGAVRVATLLQRRRTSENSRGKDMGAMQRLPHSIQEHTIKRTHPISSVLKTPFSVLGLNGDKCSRGGADCISVPSE